jgi:hypothetical protein
MAKKSRLKEDAFSWVQDTTQSVEKPKPPAKPKPAMAEKPARRVFPSGQQRSILVKYNRIGGQITGILERKGEEAIDVAWSDVAANQTVSQFTLTGELESVEVFRIHKEFRVDTSTQQPSLVPL